MKFFVIYIKIQGVKMNICSECRRLIKVWFIYAIVFYVIVFNYNITPALFFLLVSFALFSSLGVWAAIVEVFSVFFPVLILYFLTDNIFIIYLLPLVNICLIMAYRAGRNMAYIISTIYIIFWMYLSFKAKLSTVDYVVIAVSIINLLFHIYGLFIKHREDLNWQYFSKSSDNLDKNILNALSEGLYDIKGSIKKTDVINDKDNLVLLVKVKYFIINTRDLKELYNNLPKVTDKKKAFIIYSATFFPDMAYIPLWFMLYLKGYRVMGRAYYIHSIAEIKFANIYFAAERDMLHIMKKGIFDMADGFKSALPMHIYLLPFSLIFYILGYFKYKLVKAN